MDICLVVRLWDYVSCCFYEIILKVFLMGILIYIYIGIVIGFFLLYIFFSINKFEVVFYGDFILYLFKD